MTLKPTEEETEVKEPFLLSKSQLPPSSPSVGNMPYPYQLGTSGVPPTLLPTGMSSKECPAMATDLSPSPWLSSWNFMSLCQQVEVLVRTGPLKADGKWEALTGIQDQGFDVYGIMQSRGGVPSLTGDSEPHLAEASGRAPFTL